MAEGIEKEKTAKEIIEGLGPDDPRGTRIALLTWQIKYWKEYLRAVELEYTGLCYKDVRHDNASMQVRQLTRELRRMLIQ